MEFRRYQYGDDDYKKALQLRFDILRKPLGMTFTEEFLKKDIEDYHFALFEGDLIIATASFKEIDNHCLQMRQVAVEKSFQSNGIGSDLIKKCELELKQMGFSKIILHARESALNFYQKNNYKISSQEFFEVGIKHFRMEKVII